MQLLPVAINSEISVLEPEKVLSGPDSYLMSLRSERSRRTMTSALNRVAKLLGAKSYRLVPFNKLASSHVNAIIEILRVKDGLHPETVNLYLAALKGVFRYCWECNEMSYDSYMKLRSVKSVKDKRIKKKRVVVRPEIQALIKFCEDSDDSKGVRDAAVISVLAGCGLRREEVSGLKLSDLDLVKKELLVFGKGSKERIARVPTSTASRLEKWLALRGYEEGPLFVRVHRSGVVNTNLHGVSGQAVYDILRKRCEDLEYASIHPHALRHFYATNLLRNGIDIKTVMEMLGHESITTTQNYIDKDEAEERRAAEIADI